MAWASASAYAEAELCQYDTKEVDILKAEKKEVSV